MMRRHFLTAALATPLALVSGCHRPPKKELVLRSLVDNLLSPGIAGAVEASHTLHTAVSQLSATPSAQTAAQARSAWIDTAVRFKRANAFRDQTLAASSELVRAAFWPPRPRAIDDLVRSDASINVEDIDQLGADVRSLYALEYLLFPELSGSPFAVDTAEGVRLRQLLVAFAGSVSRRADAAAKELAATPVAARLAAEGQDAINRLVGLTVGNVEHFVANRLATIVWIASTKRSRAIDIEGGPSGISHKLGAAVMDVTAHLYDGERGPGLGALVAAVAPGVHERVRGDFAAAVASIHEFGQPLEAVALSDRSQLDALLAKLKTLEIALRSELASALGVTLTFSSADAD
ncbi:MAG TPA: imelysin family protein [Polyangiaceae bacterium]|nr:imelysin family protein [Polyangiaceae bacterium]